MGEVTVNNILGRGVDLMSCHIRGADKSSELHSFCDMCGELGFLIAIWLRGVTKIGHKFISLNGFNFCMESGANGSDGKGIG